MNQYAFVLALLSCGAISAVAGALATEKRIQGAFAGSFLYLALLCLLNIIGHVQFMLAALLSFVSYIVPDVQLQGGTGQIHRHDTALGRHGAVVDRL